MGRSQAIAEAFFADLMASFDNAHKCFKPLYLAFGDGSEDSVFGVDTCPGYIFDDLFWDIFHTHPLHVCHVTRLTDGPQFDEGRVFEIRFKVSKEQAALEQRMDDRDEVNERYEAAVLREANLEQRAERLEKNLILAAKTITGTSAGCWAPLRSRFCGEPVVGVVYSLPVCEFHLANRPALAAEEEA